MQLRLYFIFVTILIGMSLVNPSSEIELDKRCDKRERLLDERENEQLSTVKVHKNYLDALLKRVRSEAEDIELDVDDVEKEIFNRDDVPVRIPSNMDSYKQNYDKLSPVDKIVPRLHGFLMVTPEKPSGIAPTPVDTEENHDEAPNIYELLNILIQKVHESCNEHPLRSPDEKLLNVLTRLKRFLSEKEVQK